MMRKYKVDIALPAPGVECIQELNSQNAHTTGRFIFDFSLFLATMGSATFLAIWGDFNSAIVFVVMLVAFLINTFVSDFRLQNRKLLRVINGQECIAMVDFLKHSISPEVHLYVQQVKNMGREFTVAEFDALQAYENKYFAQQKEANARSLLYQIN